MQLHLLISQKTSQCLSSGFNQCLTYCWLHLWVMRWRMMWRSGKKYLTLSWVPRHRGLKLAGFLQARFADGRFVTYRTKLGGKNGGKSTSSVCFKHSGMVVFPADSMAGRSASQHPPYLSPSDVFLPFSCYFPPVDFKKTRKQTNK